MTHAHPAINDAVAFAKRYLDSPVLARDAGARQPVEADFAEMGRALEQAAINPDTNDFDTLIVIAAAHLRQGESMPGWLATFAADVLEGKRKRPTKRGRDEYSNWERDYRLWRATQEVATAFSMPSHTNNELSNKPTAAHAVSLAAGCSVDVVITACKKFNRQRG